MTNPVEIEAMLGDYVPRNWFHVEMWNPQDSSSRGSGDLKERSYFRNTDAVYYQNASSSGYDVFGKITCIMGPWSQDMEVYFGAHNHFFGGIDFAMAPRSVDNLQNNEKDLSYDGNYGYWHIYGIKFRVRKEFRQLNLHHFTLEIDCWQDQSSNYPESQW